MKTTLSTHEAANILLDDEFANWSRGAAFALVEYLEELEGETGEEFELDRIAIRCEWSEYGTLEEWAEDYGADLEEAPEDDEERDEEIRDYIYERGQLIEFDGGVLVSAF